MFDAWTHLPPRRRIVENPDDLGYRLTSDPLLEVLDAEGWYALERAAVGAAAGASSAR